MPSCPRISLPCALALACLASSMLLADDAHLEPLEQVSGSSPFVDCTADAIGSQSGNVFVHSEVEPWVAVNPLDPLNVVATWQQDRWSDGGARGLGVGVSFDGGQSWESVVVPGLTRCSGGVWLRASDPWVSFGPDGAAYHIALAFNPGNAMVVNKSVDGGLTWSGPVVLAWNGFPLFNDKESITADPTDPDLVYAAWDRVDFRFNSGPAVFTRSTDGGLTWEPVRVLHNPGFNAQTLAHQIVVQPGGTVFDFFTEILSNGAVFLSFKRSFDQGSRWEPVSGVLHAAAPRPLGSVTPPPDLRIPIRDGAYLFDVAVDPRDGSLYAVWQDGGPAAFQYPVVLFTMSTDGGDSWTPPVVVNRTPGDVGRYGRQAFLPSVHVSANGTVGVSYYDFRNTESGPGALTDHWFVSCHPQAADCTNPDRWRNELRLTERSFDMLGAPVANGRFVGDYVGLSSAAGDFVAVFTQPHDDDPASAFSRRIVIDEIFEPRSNGFWKHQLRVAATGRGRAHESPSALRGYLADIRALWDTFAAVEDLAELWAVLDPAYPASMGDRARQHAAALLLNVVSARISPFIDIGDTARIDDLVDLVSAIVADPASSASDLEAAKDLAETINQGLLPTGWPVGRRESSRPSRIYRIGRDPAPVAGGPVTEPSRADPP